MKHLLLSRIAVALLVGGAAAVVARAQDAPPPPPPGQDGGPGQGGPGGFGGPGGGRGFGGPGMRGGPRELTVSRVPVEALASYLNLTDAQQTSIAGIVDAMQKSRPRPPRPPQDNADGTPPPRPTPEEVQAMMQKMQAAGKKADDDITAVLTAPQKAQLPTLLKALTALQAVRFDLAAAPKLKLTDDQVTRLAALGIKAKVFQVKDILTADQNAVVAANPARGRGGFGGPGGGPGGRGGRGPGGGGGFGGPGGPPPDGGQGAPPPPPQD